VLLSVVIITLNEETNIARTLSSVAPLVSDGSGEIIVVDSGSTDRTVEIAKSFGAKVFVEPWKGFAAQKNSAINKASSEWILSLDADEELDTDLQQALQDTLEGWCRYSHFKQESKVHPLTLEDTVSDVEWHVQTRLDNELSGLWVARKNFFLGRWVKHGGFFPDPKLRLFRRGKGYFEDRAVHETLKVEGSTGTLRYGTLLHHAYPTLAGYIEHMNRYSSLGAEMASGKGLSSGPWAIVARPIATFLYNYFFRLGFLDGREGLLLHLSHAGYVFWKYAKIWELRETGRSAH
jgi:glycosyltransferase involved in cell wall biosynthesis